MKPENLVIRNGCYIMRIDSFIDYSTKKPTCRITCIEDGRSYDDDFNEIDEAIFYPHKQDIDTIIAKLNEVKEFLK